MNLKASGSYLCLVRCHLLLIGVPDLVPSENAQVWSKRTTPTLPFRSAGSHQCTNLSSTGTAPVLLLKAYKPSAAQSMTVGVVSFLPMLNAINDRIYHIMSQMDNASFFIDSF